MTECKFYTCDLTGNESTRRSDMAKLEICIPGSGNSSVEFEGHIHLDTIPEGFNELVNKGFGSTEVIILVTGTIGRFCQSNVSQDLMGVIISSDIQGQVESWVYSKSRLYELEPEFANQIETFIGESREAWH